MNALDGEIIEAYKRACHGFQLTGTYVLQSFARALNVPGYLGVDTVTARYYATQVFSTFTKAYSPLFPLNPVKRIQGIRHLRCIIRVTKSFRSEDEKERAYEHICNHWFQVNGIKGEGSELWLHPTLSVTLPKDLLLLCDLFRCPPLNLLHYFMEEVVLQMEHSTTDGAAIEFILHCVASKYPIKNN